MNADTVSLDCSGCGRKLQAPAALAGRTISCPVCGRRLLAPAHGKTDTESLDQSDVVALPPHVTPLKPPKTLDSPGLASQPDPTLASQLDSGGPPTIHDKASVPTPATADRRRWDFLRPPQGPDEIGRLGGHRILRLLGQGGMGIVFEAQDTQLERPVALKVLLPHVAETIPGARQRFLREARAMAAIEHDHIVTIYQVGEDRGVPFLAMQLLRGESLDRRLQREGRLPLADTLRIGREMAAALAVAHERGLIHRDIKPSNVWLEGKRGRVKLLDFGLALANDDLTLTQPGMIVGTPAYMAPEQAAASHDVDHRCDLFSLGCVLYRMSTGVAPFSGSGTMSLLLALEQFHPEPPARRDPSLPWAFSELVMQLLAKDPAERPQSALAVAEQIERLESELARSQPTPVVNEVRQDQLPGRDGSRSRAPIAAAVVSQVPAAKRPAPSITVNAPSTANGSEGAARRAGRGGRRWLILAVLAVVATAASLGGLYGFGLLGPFDRSEDGGDVVEGPAGEPAAGEKPKTENVKKKPTAREGEKPPIKEPVLEFPVDPVHRVCYQCDDFRNFGLALVQMDTPAEKCKAMIFPTDGRANTTMLRIDNEQLTQFGKLANGQWLKATPAPDWPRDGKPLARSRTTNVWQMLKPKIRVTQSLDVVAGRQPVEVKPGEWRWVRDCCLTAFRIENRDSVPHQVGLRLLLRVHAGDNHGPLLVVPGRTEPVAEHAEFAGEKLPVFVRAIESADLHEPGTVTHFMLKPAGDLEPPTKVAITAWTSDQRPFDIPLANIGVKPCLAVYWQDKLLQPGEQRTVGFTCGAGHLAATPRQEHTPQLALTADGSFTPGQTFVVLAQVQNWEAGLKLRLALEPGLTLVGGEGEQAAPQPFASTTSLVSWTVRAEKAGRFEIAVESNTKLRQQQTVFILPPNPLADLGKKNLFDELVP